MSLQKRSALAVILALLGVVTQAHGQNLIVNGDFEAGGGSFTGWTPLDQAGGNGQWYVQSGLKSPKTGGFAVPAPPSPTHAAMSDQSGPGSHVLYQDFVVPAGITSAVLTFNYFRGNRGIAFTLPKDLDYKTPTNQLARVDFITTAANPFSVLPADVLLNVFMTTPTDPKVDPAYVPFSLDVTAFLNANVGQTLRFRIAEVDNSGIFQFGIDDVAITIGGPPPPPGVTITQSGGTTNVAESGTTDTYDVVLKTAPTADVTITITGDAQVTVAPATLTFTSANWNVAQTVTVNAVDDAIVEGAHTGTIMHAAASADAAYNAIVIASVTANIADNDGAPAGVTIVQSGGSTNVAEGGMTDTYTIVLTSAPTAPVTITISAGPQVTAAPGVLVFTPASWNVARTVTVTAVNDAVVEGAHFGTITHTAASGDAAYNLIAIASVTANIADNDSAPPGGGISEGTYGGSKGLGNGNGKEGTFGFGRRLETLQTLQPFLKGPYRDSHGNIRVFNVARQQRAQAEADSGLGVVGWGLLSLGVLMPAVLVYGRRRPT